MPKKKTSKSEVVIEQAAADYSGKALVILEPPKTEPNDRALFVRDRLHQLNRDAGNMILENGALLLELKENSYYKEFGYDTFEECINDMQNRGEIDYSARQARNFMAITTMTMQLGLGPNDIKDICISKMREIATLPIDVDSKKDLIEKSKDLTVAEVQEMAKEMRDKSYGNDKDPLKTLVLHTSETQREFILSCIKRARTLYSIPDDAGDAYVLCDAILAEWSSGV